MKGEFYSKMVNNVSGSNPNIYVDTRNQGNTGNVQQPVNSTQNGGYRSDGYAFNLNTPADTPVPDVKVGLFDKMGVTFKDVLNTDDNVKRFVAFENAIKNNPNGYLQPGSNDVTKVTDLQKKLKLLGTDITVNGQFGKATEQAVINFKNSVGINDGYLTKNGHYAVTGTMTPQAWGVLNASVAARMNPNANISNGTYTPPVTKQEMQWAKDLQSKITNYGYKPSPAERTKYEDIYQRQRMTMQINTGSFDPTKVSKPTETEMQWAQDLAVKMKQYGYKPNDAEKTKYQDIFQRLQVTKNSSTTNPQPKNQISQSDTDWAVNLMNRVKSGYNPTDAEAARYEKIYAATQNQQVEKKNTPPTQDELKWASELEKKVSQGYNPTAQEKAKYTKIFENYKANPPKVENTETTSPSSKPSDTEMSWAQDLENRVNNQGYQPTQAEIDKYTDIYNRLTIANAPKPQPKTQVEQPDDTTGVETKSNDPYNGATVEKFGKIGSALNDWTAKHPGENFPREQIFYANQEGQLISQSQLNAAAKQDKNYISTLGLKNAPALYIPGFSTAKAADYSYQNGHIYNSSLQSSATTEDVATTPKPKKQTSTQTVSSPQVDNNNGVSKEELDWAADLQQRSAQGYKPSQEEIAIYTDIYQRYQSGGNNQQSQPTVQPKQNQQPVYTSPQANNTVQPQPQPVNVQMVNVDANNSDQELQWALNLLNRVQQQGYQPTEQELSQYEQIIAKHQSVQ